MNFSLSSKTPQTLINEIENKLKYFSVDQLYNLNFMLLCELSKKGNTQSAKYETIGYNKFENLMNNQKFEEIKETRALSCYYSCIIKKVNSNIGGSHIKIREFKKKSSNYKL